MLSEEIEEKKEPEAPEEDVPTPEAEPEVNMDADGQWFVVRVQSGREEQVRDGLKRRVRSAGLKEKVTNVVVPTEKVTEIRSGRKAIRDKKLYPGYLMIQMVQDDGEPNKDAWFLIRETPGIGDFLGLKEPIPMAEHEVNRMLNQQVDDEEAKPQFKIEFQKGDAIRVREGAFENFEGIVEEINSQRGLVTVTITIFGRATRVDLEYWQVEKT